MHDATRLSPLWLQKWLVCACLLPGMVFAGGALASKPLQPIDTPFDPEQALAMLDPGNAIIRGRSAWKKTFLGIPTVRKQEYGKNLMVKLFPMTPYMEAWYKRFKSDPDLGIRSYMHRDVAQYSAEVATDGQGNFEFLNLKPGRYLLYTLVPYVEVDTWRDQVGTQTGYNVYGLPVVSTPIYGEEQSRTRFEQNDILKIVEIKEDGQVLDLGTIR